MEIDIHEKAIIQGLRSRPELKACFLEMLDITDGEAFEQLDLGDDAETAVIDVTRKTALTLLGEWAKKKARRAEEEVEQGTAYRAHEKKRPNGRPL
jgi:hypothetical protein